MISISQSYLEQPFRLALQPQLIWFSCYSSIFYYKLAEKRGLYSVYEY